MRKILLFPLLLGSASLAIAAPTTAPKPPAAAGKPALGEIKVGELRLDGKISAFLGTGLWQLDAVSWTSPRGVKTDFDDPKPKSVQLAADAFIHAPNSATKIDIKDIKLKSIVAVIGKNGADGTVMVREVIVLENYGDKETVGTLSINPKSHNLIGQSRAARSAGQIPKALDLARQAAENAAASGDLSGEALCLQDLGGLYIDLKQGSNALSTFKRAQSIGERMNNPMVRVLSMEGQGRILAASGQTDEATSILEQAVTISANATNTIQMGALETLAQVHIRAGKRGEAVGALLRLFPIQEQAGKYDDATETLFSIIELQATTDPGAARGRVEEARDRLNNIRQESRRMDLTVDYADALKALKDDAGAAAQYEAAAKLAEAKNDTDAAAAIRAKAAGNTPVTPAAPAPADGGGDATPF